jgi:beta-galactosidase/beta-glucuronidase
MNKVQGAQGRSGRAMGGGGPQVDGKFLRVDGERFFVRGVTYGTFAETELGPFPGLKQVEEDFAAMAVVGINTVRTYTVPGQEILNLAEEAGLKVLMGFGGTTRGIWIPPTGEAGRRWHPRPETR